LNEIVQNEIRAANAGDLEAPPTVQGAAAHLHLKGRHPENHIYTRDIIDLFYIS